MNLVDVYTDPAAETHLYALLGDREAYENISHRTMPHWREHQAFVRSKPYPAWYLIAEQYGLVVGTIYLTKHREVGIHLFEPWRGRGLGKTAIALLREKHPGPLLANVNPANEPSIAFFTKTLGGELIQHTYRIA